jgi:hypothetical protein
MVRDTLIHVCTKLKHTFCLFLSVFLSVCLPVYVQACMSVQQSVSVSPFLSLSLLSLLSLSLSLASPNRSIMAMTTTMPE